MPISTIDTSSISGLGYGFKNRIINGAVVIDQRNAGASVTPANTAYTLDRWQTNVSQSSKISVQQSSVAPTGFTSSLLVTSLAATSLGSTDFFGIFQPIEGYNVADFGFGSAGASSITVSFWVRSSLTGTFGASIWNDGQGRCYPFSYTISAANTWEQKTATIAGDTSGTWLKTNGLGLSLYFALGVGATYSNTAGSWHGSTAVSPTGATSVVGTSGATFYITGVQLEKGSTATSFDYRPYGTELQLCQRYYTTIAGPTQFIGASAFSTNRVLSCAFYPATMRATPTATTSASITWFYNGGAGTSSAVALTPSATGSVALDITVTAIATTSGTIATNAPIRLSAEL